MRVVAISAAALVLQCAALDSPAQAPIRLIDFVEASDGERNVDVQVQFNCSVRYMTHEPLDIGAKVRIRLRLGQDCGVGTRSIAGELPTIGGDSRIVRAVRLEEAAPGDAALILEWSRDYNFVIAPTANGRGVRVRILNVFSGKARVMVIETDEPTSGYAINLESSTTPFGQADIDVAHALLKTSIYVSTIELEATKWYRLRAGPIIRRQDAERLLAAAQQRYTRAWLGIDDEPGVVGEPANSAPTVAPTTPVDPSLPDGELKKLMDEARKAMSRRDYAKATAVLTKLTRQPEYAARSRAQELLGLTRERAGQLAHAKAEYQEYLRRYPDGDAAGRIRKRLRVLATAALAGKAGTRGGGAEDPVWKITGGAAQTYRWENNSLTTPETSTSQQTQNAVYTDGDFIARRRGEQYDFVARVSAGYAKDMLTDGPGDQTRVSAAFVELTDRGRGIAARFGRQSRNSGGLLGTFDGLFGSYQLKPRLALNIAAGYPVESTRESPQTDRKFVGVSADFGPFREHWDFSTYLIAQTYAGETDRRAIGFEARYFAPGRTLVGLIDYDLFYQELNSIVLMGSWALPARWSMSFNVDHRQSPVLTTRNALIGQPVASLDQLLGLFTAEEIRRLAEDRTPVSDAFSVSVSRPLGERFELSLDAFASRAAASVASGGVEATPATGLDKTLQMQLSGSSLWKSSDWWVLQLRSQDSANSTIDSVGLATRIPVGGAWRLGPRLRVDRRSSKVDLAEELLYVPTLRLDYQKGRTWIEFEGGAELGHRDLPADDEKSKRYYFGIGYRLTF